MASGLRNKTKVDYSALNDLPSDVVKLICKKPKSLNWKPDDYFPIEVLERCGPNELKIHFSGYSHDYDEIIHRSNLRIDIPVEGLNGPSDLQSFIGVLKQLISGELRANGVPKREIRIETVQSVIDELVKKLCLDKFPAVVSLNKWETILGRQFQQRIYNAAGDATVIATGLTCRIYYPQPDVLFKPVNALLVEHHILKNPIFVASFATDDVPANLNNSFEFR